MKLLKALQELHNGTLIVHSQSICGIIERLCYAGKLDDYTCVTTLATKLQSMFMSWDEFSGNPEFPIAGSNDLTAQAQFRECYSCNSYWLGSQGLYRHRLVRHTIAVLLKEELLAILKSIKSEVSATDTGICGNVTVLGRKRNLSFADRTRMARYAMPLCETWGNYSGDVFYPVPSGDPKIISAVQFEMCADDENPSKYWEGKQGELRNSLLTHMIKELSNAVT